MKKKVYVLLGPTGIGKTEIIDSLQEGLYEIISCDTRQIYKGLERISAAPTSAQQKKHPYHFVSILSVNEKPTAGTFLRKTNEILPIIYENKKIPIIVGGAYFYYQTLVYGMFGVKTPPAVRQKVEEYSHEQRVDFLQCNTPQAFKDSSDELDKSRKHIHPNDTYRVQRAMEIFLTTGKDWNQHWQNALADRDRRMHESPFSFIGFRLHMDRDKLWEKLQERIIRMVSDPSIINEVEALYKLYGDCPAMETLGCRDIYAFARGEIKQEELIEQLNIQHRQYAKKQRISLQQEKNLQATSKKVLMDKIVEQNGIFPESL